MTRRGALATLCFALHAFAPAHAVDVDGPAAFAVRVPVMPAAGAPLQRLAVPAQLLVASRRAGLADLRLFDAQGQAVPIALSTVPPMPSRRTVAFAALPILGAAGTLAVTGVSLRVDDAQHARVVRVEGTPRDTAGSTVLGVLLDTRRLADPVEGLALDAQVPRGQPVTFTIEASADLKRWQPIAEKILYRASATAPAEPIRFDQAADLRGRYLRIGWSAASRLVAPVVVRGARLTVLRNADATPRPRAEIRVATPADPHVIDLALPFATPIAALEVRAVGENVVVPVRILGRADREQAWTPIAAGTVFRLRTNGVARGNAPFDLRGSGFRLLRIEADARTAGFAAPPAIAALFDPVRILFLAAGAPPFVLAAGRADAPAAFLPPESLVPGYSPAVEAALPSATIAAAPMPLVDATDDDTGARRSVLLWAALLLGTALLGAMVWLLLRQRGRPA